LAFGSQVRFGYDVDDVTIFGKQLAEGLDQRWDLDTFFEVGAINTIKLISYASYMSKCNDTYVALGGMGAAIVAVLF